MINSNRAGDRNIARPQPFAGLAKDRAGGSFFSGTPHPFSRRNRGDDFDEPCLRRNAVRRQNGVRMGWHGLAGLDP
jgi:hypothetical protein